MAQSIRIKGDRVPDRIPARHGGMFGTFVRRIDDSGRASVPSPFRRFLETGPIALYFLRRDRCIEGFDTHCLAPVTDRDTDEIFSNLHKVLIDKRIADAVYEVALDGRGRIKIPSELKTKIGLTDKIGIVGFGKRFRIYAESSIP
jgi:DNA-binding transcriptional regulator/RsmH inhibitor MraZ